MPHHQCISNCKGYKFQHHIQEFLHKLSDCISESSAIALRRESAVGLRGERQLQGSALCGTRSRAAKRGETLSRYPRGRLLRFPSEGHFDPVFFGGLSGDHFSSMFLKGPSVPSAAFPDISFRGDWDEFCLWMFLGFHSEVTGMGSACGCS